MNIGFQISDDECGFDEDVWIASHERVFGDDVEGFVRDITLNTKAPEIARDAIKRMRDERPPRP